MKEFNLSNKIAHGNFSNIQDFIRVKDVKKFIKKLKERLFDEGAIKIIDKLVGEELI